MRYNILLGSAFRLLFRALTALILALSDAPAAPEVRVVMAIKHVMAPAASNAAIQVL